VRTVAETLRWRAARHHDLTALSFQGRTTSFGQLDASSSELAAGLASRLGVQPGSRVAILDKNSDRYLELIFALAKAGAVMVPVNWRLKPREVAQIVNDASPNVFVVGDDFRSSAGEVDCRVLGFDELPRGGPDPRQDAEEMVVWQLYTSGTTGAPKGAMLSNRNVVAAAASLGLEFPEMVEGSACLMTGPLYHIGGCGWALAALTRGASVVLIRDVKPTELLATIVEERVATGHIVPAVLLALTQMPGIGEADFSALKNIAYGASPISPTLLETAIRTFGCRFTQLYGLTETSGAITALRHEDHEGERLLSCGRAMFGCDVRIMNQAGEWLPVNDVGEIVFRGPSLMEGYQRPGDTADVIRDGWFHTGDAGSADADGFIYIRDRIKDMIVSGAENIYPAELESVLAAHPAVADIAVIGVPDDRWGETVKAMVVRRSGHALTAEDLIEWSRSRLAGYKRPRSVDFVDVIPRNPSGKILKRELRERYWSETSRRVN
jgi:acyl-CoA synthetase (AMP-forming)/AMP-acid ligase II